MPPYTKTCQHCQQVKPATFEHFGENLRNKDRLKDYCRACTAAVLAEKRRRKAEKSREWARANREKVHASARRTYEKYRKERLAYLRTYRRENAERLNEYAREYRKRKPGEEKA